MTRKFCTHLVLGLAVLAGPALLVGCGEEPAAPAPAPSTGGTTPPGGTPKETPKDAAAPKDAMPPK